jgi:hypothetical protein
MTVKWVFFTAVAAFIIWLLVRAVFRYRAARAADDVEEVQESLWNWAAFKADLALFWRGIWRRFRPKIPQPQNVTTSDTYTGISSAGNLSVREIYRRLLVLASNAGFMRQRQETPAEYAARLGKALPELGEPIAEITGIYVPVRYGEYDTPVLQINHANNLWLTLQTMLRKIKEMLPGNRPG